MVPQQGWVAYLSEQMGLAWVDVPVIIVSAIIVYLAFLAIVRLFGARLFTSTSFSSTIGFVMLGALAGRAILGPTPTVSAGIIALLTLATLESLFHAIEGKSRAQYFLGGRPILVYLDGEALEGPCRRTHTSTVDLDAAMRGAGVANPQEVRCIILEPQGHYSVIRAGTELSPQLFKHVDGAERLFAAGK